MAVTVRGTFDLFRETKVDLDREETKTARASRDFLFSQLSGLKSKVSGFPPLSGEFISYGSFARRTKIRPLDDIDFLALMDGSGTSPSRSPGEEYSYWLQIVERGAPLSAFPDGHGYVSSTSILNKIKSSLMYISQYGQAEIKRNMQAVTLNLKSYPWTFDIVPAVPVASWGGQVEYYLIPNGRGDWMRTDPRIDAANITQANVAHSGRFLPLMRLLKYWNNRTHKPRLASYYFETLGLKIFGGYSPEITSIQQGLQFFMQHGPARLRENCPDPKGLGPNLDAGIPWETVQKVSTAMGQAADAAERARLYEVMGDHRNAVACWRTVFGPGFCDV